MKTSPTKKELQQHRPDANTIIWVVDQLNNKIQDKYSKINVGQENYIAYTTGCHVEWVSWSDIHLWSSEDDAGRKFDEVSNTAEPFDKFIKRRFNEEVENMSKLKLR